MTGVTIKVKVALVVAGVAVIALMIEGMNASTLLDTSSDMVDHNKLSSDSNIQKVTTLASVNNEPQRVSRDGITLSFEVDPKDIHANILTNIKMTISDERSGKPISHVDWSVIIKNEEGKEVFRSSTIHTHVGMLHLINAFPEAGNYKISVQVASLGPKMMNMDVPAMAQTRILLSGDVMNGWNTDPNLFFGIRSFEFNVKVEGNDSMKVVDGTEPGKRIVVQLSTDPRDVFAGTPATLMFNVKSADDGVDVTHVEARVSVIGKLIPSMVVAQPMGNDMMPMMGAFHGHTGQFALTTIFPMSGKYIVKVELNSLPVSNYIFGKASTRFIVNVSDTVSKEGGRDVTTTKVSPSANQIIILGQDPPFFIPNNITVKAGTVVTIINNDAIIHTVTSTSDDVGALSPTPNGLFDTGLIRHGEEKQITLDKPGTYNYFCTLHPFMRGSITVT